MADEKHVLRVSVETLDMAPISGLHAEPTIVAAQRRITLKTSDRHLVLEAGDFDSETEALSFLPQLKAGLWNLAIEHSVAFDPEFRFRNVAASMTQEPGYTVYRSGEKIRVMSASLTGCMSMSWQGVAATLIEGIELSRALNDSDADRKLGTAIELYLASFYERAHRARFLTRMTALEVLAPATEKHAIAVELLTEFHTTIGERLASETDKDARDALEALMRETDFRREASIRRRMRRLILDEAPFEDVARKALAKELVAAYDVRSQLIHTGAETPDLGSADETALKALKIILRRRLGLTPSNKVAAQVGSF